MPRRFFLLPLLLLAFLSASAEQVAYQDAHVRFTLISESAVRLEWSATGAFCNQSSFLAVAHDTSRVAYKAVSRGKRVRITTSALVLQYTLSDGPLTAANLSIRSPKGAAVPFCWHPGDEQTGNLGGTARTLDGCDGTVHYDWNRRLHRRDTLALELEPGLLARCGWTLIDDSRNFLFTDEPEPWVTTRADSTAADSSAQDLYFLAYGHDYKRALRDYTRFAGRIPLPPRFAFGYWWSRYWAYSDADFRHLIASFDSLRIPIDVLVIDMDWHYSDGKRGGWTGYNWNRELIPEPDSLLGFIHRDGLHTTLNLHPADGIKTWEERWPAVAASLGVTDSADIPWQGSNRAFMHAWFEEVLRPMERQGVDFWWLDWQQWPFDRALPALSNTWWLNYCVFSDMERHRTTRPMLYHRWGGLGNHRYQVGFSGDSYSTWASLRYQPVFNSTASNVLYGYWSHDLGGHMLLHKTDSLDQELLVRWMQFGCFSPIMRTHSTNDRRMTKEPWVQRPENQRILADIIRLRYRLAPYIYTMARHAYDTGVSLCRPLYYDWPEAPEAYQEEWSAEYMFGDNLLVAPIGQPMEGGVSALRVWLPEGLWYDFFTGEKLQGGRIIERSYRLDQYPVFVKAGTILPLYDGSVTRLGGALPDPELLIFPGADGSFTLYEDAGDSKDYDTCYRLTPMHYSDASGLTVEPTVSYPSGTTSQRSFRTTVFGAK